MPKIIRHPKRDKCCAFCTYWFGDAGMELVNLSTGYRVDNLVRGKCAKRGFMCHAICAACNQYKPSREAERFW